MGATLDALYRLQSIESQLRSVREQVEAKNRRLAGEQRRLSTLQQQITDTRHVITRAQSEADSLELERKTHEAHIAKLREALNQAKSNKEYAAILTQLNTDKADALRLEDRVLTALGKIDEQKKKLAELQGSLDREKGRLAEMQQDKSELEGKLAHEMKELESQREEAAGAIGPETLLIFERACEQHDGEAMAMVGRVHPKRAEYICTGCHMSLPLEHINVLQTRDEVQLCPNCMRILCLDIPASASAQRAF